MRTAFDSEFITNNGKRVGIFTGADFCAEHEWGIRPLQRSLGIPEKGLGIERRIITKSKNVRYLFDLKPKGEIVELLIFGYPVIFGYVGKGHPKFASAKAFWAATQPRQNLYCEWDEEGLAIAVKGKVEDQILCHLYRSIIAGTCYLAFGGKEHGLRGGLNIIDVKDIPQNESEAMLVADKDNIKLAQASEATGIIAKLQAVGGKCAYYACRARWCNENEVKRTKHPVIYWLNPQSQDKVNFGWFTVEELEQWIEGKEPIPKKLDNRLKTS